MPFPRRRGAALAACALLASACADRMPTTAAPPADGEVTRTVFTCTATVQQPSLRCEEAPGGGGASQNIILGGQGTNVRLASSDPSYDGTSTFRVNVTVQNLLAQRMGTAEGVVVYGVKVFFVDGPVATGGSGSVALANPDGRAFFTAAEQPYFLYPEMLEAHGTSDPREWRFTVPPSVESFRFAVYVETRLPAEEAMLRWVREAGALLPPAVGLLDAVWAAGPYDVFAAGQNSILHFDGADWSVMKRTDGWMRDIAGNSVHDAYAVGDEGRVLHFDGSVWLDAPMPSLNGTLFGVWVQGPHVVAVGVGASEDGTRRVGKIYRSSDGGDTWHIQESAGPEGRELLDVWGSGPDDLYAVGSDFTPNVAGSARALVLRSTDGGATWQEFLHQDNTERFYNAVWGADAGNVLVGGTRVDSATGRRQAVVLYSTDGGETWDETIVSDAGSSRDVRSIWGTPTGEVYAVGGFRTLIRWDGTRWEDLTTGPGPTLLAVHGTEEGHVFAVGSGQSILRHDGTSWQTVSPFPASNVTFRSVGGGGVEVFAVGHRPRTGGGGVEGVVYRRLDGGWTPAYTADSTEVLDVWGSGASTAYAVGRRIRSATSSSGVILRWNGAFWSDISPAFPRDRELSAVWGTGPDDVWVLGSQLTEGGAYVMVALHSTNGGQTWSEETTPLADASRPYVSDVHGVSSTEIYAVGRTSIGGRLVFRRDGGAWVQEGVAPSSQMDGVRVVAPGQVYAVGSTSSGGTPWAVFWRRNASDGTWVEYPPGRENGTRFHGITADPGGGIYAVGAGLRMGYWKNNAWTEMGPDYSPPLRAVWFTPQGNAYAVGENGIILHGMR